MTAKLLHQHQACKVPRPQHPLPKAIWRKLVLELKVGPGCAIMKVVAWCGNPDSVAKTFTVGSLPSSLIGCQLLKAVAPVTGSG